MSELPFDNPHAQLLHDWTISHLRLIKPDGVVMVPDNSPLSTEEIAAVLERVAASQEWRGQTVSVPDRNGSRSILRMADDKAIVDSGAVQDEPHERRLPDGMSVFIKDEEVPNGE